MAKQEKYLSYLREEGYVPELGNDGNIRFKFEGGNYTIIVNENDEDYFHLVYPNFWRIESEDERELAAKAAGHATKNTKVVKIFPVGNNVWATAEMFCSPPEAFAPVFLRLLRALQHGVRAFKQQMSETMLEQDLLIKAIIRENKCTVKEATALLGYTKNLHSQLEPVLQSWVEDGTILDFSINGVDIPSIMDKLQTTFLPALFHMNRFIENSDETERFKRLRVANKDVVPAKQKGCD